MDKYRITVLINNIVEHQEIVEANSKHNAIDQVRNMMKKRYENPEIHFTNLVVLN